MCEAEKRKVEGPVCEIMTMKGLALLYKGLKINLDWLQEMLSYEMYN